MNPLFLSHDTPLLQLYYNQSQTFPSIYSAQSPSELAYKTYLLQTQSAQLMQLRNLYVQKLQTLPKLNLSQLPQQSYSCLKIPETTLCTPISLPASKLSSNDSSPKAAQPSVKEPIKTFGELTPDLRKQLEGMVRMILSNVNRNGSFSQQSARDLYSKSPILLQIYDKLVMKYFSAKKCREDIVRYILRKAFKVARTDLIRKERISYKRASLALCKKFFASKLGDLEAAGVTLENEEELFEFIMPYKKNSKNRTMNTSFVLEIFTSAEFCTAYDKFLKKFHNILQVDNNKKMQKLLDLLLKCVQKNDISTLNKITRLPWLDVWLDDTKDIAFSLMPRDLNKENKLLKKEEGF